MLMKTIFLFITAILWTFHGFSQDFNSYKFVVVPVQYEFQNKPNEYQLNEMAVFYLEKIGFNAFLSDDTPNLNKCDGLYMDVDFSRSLLKTRMEIVFNDCEENEIFRSEKGRSKLKEYDKSYQDALRQAFMNMNSIKVKQAPISDNDLLEDSFSEIQESSNYPKIYIFDSRTFRLDKTEEGYSLYEKTETDKFELFGKIIKVGAITKLMDVSGNVFDVDFSIKDLLIIGEGQEKRVFKRAD